MQHIATIRLGQVSGRSGPDWLFHYQDTSQWGIEGVDLGASTVHFDKTYIFFGDVPKLGRDGGPAHNADAIGVIDDIRVPPHACIGAGKQLANQSDAFFIGENGALFVAWVVGGGNWFQPFQISPPNLAPPGACIAVAHQSDEQLDVFFIGNNGGLHVAWVEEGGIWQGPQQISDSNIAKPGGKLVAIKQNDNQLDVFFIGQNRRLHVAWVIGGSMWQGPQVVGEAHIPYPEPGAGIAACKQGTDQLDVFFIGDDGAFYVAWSTAGGVWQGPIGVSPPNITVTGANLAAFNQGPDQLTVQFVSNEGRLCSMWVVGGGVWQGPAPAVPGLYPAKPGTPITVARQSPNQWDTFLVNENGGIDVYWAIDSDPWEGPFQIAPPGSSFDDGTVAVVQQLDDQMTVISSGRTGELNVNWVKGLGPWQGPVCINPTMTTVRFVTDGPYFHPFTVRGSETDPNLIWQPLGDGTPTGVFSHGGKVYVFVYSDGLSSLTSSDWPDGPKPFTFEFVLSRLGDGFLQVAPVVMRSEEIPGLNATTEEGVLLFGHGAMSPGAELRLGCIDPKGPSGVNLAFVPLVPGSGPSKTGLRYYAGNQSWVTDESAGRSLFTTCYYWTSLSAGRIPGTGKWILLYQLSGPREVMTSHHLPIVARIADTPWEIGTAPDIAVFDPQRDAAWGRFMFGPQDPDSDRNMPHIGHPAFAYGAYLLHKYMQWDNDHHLLTIFYLMSTGRPYQVQLMKTIIAV
ncbi:MAG: hypothetical protein CV088_00420 [Nitrospira sp. LK70]|nr:hypothetical protein [Nitrospira sp. LK70]